MKFFIILIVIVNTLIFAFISYNSYLVNENMKEIKISIDDIKKGIKSVGSSVDGVENKLRDIEYKLPYR